MSPRGDCGKSGKGTWCPAAPDATVTYLPTGLVKVTAPRSGFDYSERFQGGARQLLTECGYPPVDHYINLVSETKMAEGPETSCNELKAKADAITQVDRARFADLSGDWSDGG